LAATRPALVRSTIRERSKSAIPANTVRTMRPAGVVVSAHGSASDRRPATVSLIRSAMSRRSRVDRANRSRRVTVTTSPARRCSNRRLSSGLSRFAPLAFSSKFNGCLPTKNSHPISSDDASGRFEIGKATERPGQQVACLTQPCVERISTNRNGLLLRSTSTAWRCRIVDAVKKDFAGNGMFAPRLCLHLRTPESSIGLRWKHRPDDWLGMVRLSTRRNG
jgi:hypothetical protein